MVTGLFRETRKKADAYVSITLAPIGASPIAQLYYRCVVKLAETADLESVFCRFESYHADHC